MEVAVEIEQLASGAGRIEQRAELLLETLRRLVPFRAAGVFLLDAEHGGLMPAADQGYDEAVRAYITSRANLDEIEMLGFNRASMRWWSRCAGWCRSGGAWISLLEPERCGNRRWSARGTRTGWTGT